MPEQTATPSPASIPVHLAPDALPRLNIIELAQEGKILRAERETPPDGVPVFVTKGGWDELMRHHGAGEDPARVALTKLLPALERISAQLLAQAAEASRKEREAQTQEDKAGSAPSVFTLESDLFPSNRDTRLVLVRDTTHPVVCALLGTPEQLAALMATTSGFTGESPPSGSPH